MGHLCGDQGHCGNQGTLWRSGTLLDHLCGDHGHCWATAMIRTLLGHLCGDQKHCWATAVIRDTAVIRGTAGPLVRAIRDTAGHFVW
ncbi:unnamed protein product [Staurois parvus]|uniref:Uncharacterized protein n=1 Tax=Staurois parvus TaxID=386267 RepID=A0ABN9AS99_9NEOB|nr:unnamed protein product [Staurois parvus]